VVQLYSTVEWDFSMFSNYSESNAQDVRLLEHIYAATGCRLPTTGESIAERDKIFKKVGELTNIINFHRHIPGKILLQYLNDIQNCFSKFGYTWCNDSINIQPHRE